jgi:hypothetical protein
MPSSINRAVEPIRQTVQPEPAQDVQTPIQEPYDPETDPLIIEARARFNREAREANERSTKLELETAQQRERAAKAEHDLLALQQRLAWRRIGLREHSEFVAALKPFAGAAVEVTKLAEAEAGQFADDLMLTDAKWNVSLNMSGYVSPPPYGLKCSINDATPAGKALASVLKSLPAATVESNPKLPIVATILVGLRPPP